MKEYEVIIAGASFAGLSVASKLNCNVLLIDKYNIGAVQKSACGQFYKDIKDVGCENSILQTFDTVTIHTANSETNIPLSEPMCTFDFKKFCKTLAKRTDARIFKATVEGVKKSKDKSVVITDKGNFQSDIIVDCTGWQAVLASSLRKNYVNKKMISFGIETEANYKDNALHFFYDPSIVKRGWAWIFPIGKKSRFGVCSYVGKTNLMGNLKKFLEIYNLKIGEVHGGYFCYCLKDPVVKDIFVVGCAAGQTLPFTSEGIRRSIYFGQECGKIIQKIVNEKITFKQGQEGYRNLALKNTFYYNLLLKTQNKMVKMSATKLEPKIKLIAKILSNKTLSKYLLEKYKKI